MEGTNLLQNGITAAKAGNKKEARQILTRLLEVDSENERAWLWLSGVVESVEDRRLCLENVLALNPENKLAKKGLERLSRSFTPSLAVEPGAASMLPGRVVGSQGKPHPVADSHGGSARSDDSISGRLEDVWASDDDICAYCANRAAEDARRCSRCGRALSKKVYRYDATAVLHFFWVVLVGLGFILLFQALFQLRVIHDNGIAALYAGLTVLLLVLVVGIYNRILMAHVTSVFVIILIVILSILSLFQPFDTATLISGSVDAVVSGVAGEFVGRIYLFLKIVQVTVAVLALFYALFRVSPEFDRVVVRLTARTQRGLHTAVDYHMVARRLAAQGMWASAVLHWQRAAAIEPGSIVYQRSLAKAYLQLGFFERGIGVLKHAQHLPMQSGTQSEISQLLHWAEKKANNMSRAT